MSVGFTSEDEKKTVFDRLRAVETKMAVIVSLGMILGVIGGYAGYELRNIRNNQLSAAVLHTEMVSVKQDITEIKNTVNDLGKAQLTMTSQVLGRQHLIEGIVRDVEHIKAEQSAENNRHLDH